MDDSAKFALFRPYNVSLITASSDPRRCTFNITFLNCRKAIDETEALMVETNFSAQMSWSSGLAALSVSTASHFDRMSSKINTICEGILRHLVISRFLFPKSLAILWPGPQTICGSAQ